MRDAAGVVGPAVLLVIMASIAVSRCGSSTTTAPSQTPQPAAPAPVLAAQCDASLWNHVHDVQRLQMIKPCITVTGVVAVIHDSDDGDIEPPIVPDPAFKSLLNAGNITKLDGRLQVEAICQAPVHPDVPDARRACANFKGTVLIPPVGAHVQVTGSYTLDKDHGWMEIHPVTTITIIP